MSFQQGLSGLNGASAGLDVVGNNVANASTVGYKTSHAHFSDVYANSLGGGGAGQVGIGTAVSSITQEFTQGNITTTNNPLDIAINGNGFFRMSQNGAITYTRNGQFHLDNAGYIIDDSARRLTGYPVDATGTIVQSAPTDLQIVAATQPPKTTTKTTANVNLNAAATAIATAFDPADPTTYTNSTSLSVYDSQGFAHTVSLYFAKNATANAWDAYATVDGTAPNLVTFNGGTAGAATPLVFNGSGTLTTAMPIDVSIDLAGVATSLGLAASALSPLDFTMDFTGSTQFGSPFGVNSLTQDGYASGQLSSIAVDGDGAVTGRYTNGQSSTLGQVVLVNFNDPHGLASLGNNQWAETFESGLPQIGAPGTSNLGVLQSAAVEDSNVDLTAELVDMIELQRVYQANAQTIKTQDSVLQTLVNLR